MPKITRPYDITLTSGGGTVSLPADDVTQLYQVYYITGTATLTSSWTIEASGTLTKGLIYFLIYNATITLDGNNITLFDPAFRLTAEQALGDGIIYAYYDGANWVVRFLQDSEDAQYVTVTSLKDSAVTTTKINNLAVTEDKLASASVTTNKIADGSVTKVKLDSSLNTKRLYIPVSFETNDLGMVFITVPACTLVSCTASITSEIEATNNAIIDFYNHAGVKMGSGTITLTGGSAVGDPVVTSVPATFNTFTDGQTLSIETAKVNPGGKALLTLEILES